VGVWVCGIQFVQNWSGIRARVWCARVGVREDSVRE